MEKIQPTHDARIMGSNMFRHYYDAQEQARFRASITGYRYRVSYGQYSHKWFISETTRRIRT